MNTHSFYWKFSIKSFRIIESRTDDMRNIKYTFWQDGDFYIGFLNEYPDYETQGNSKEELLDNLKSLLADIESGEVPFIRKVEEMAVV